MTALTAAPAEGLVAALGRLDARLHRALEGHSTGDLRPAGEPRGPFETDAPDAGPRLDWLVRAYGLDRFDLDVVLLAVAPEIDLRYERLYATLQGGQEAPTVDLALTLLAGTPYERIAHRARFAADAPLVRERLLHLVPPIGRLHAPLLAQVLVPDRQIVDVLTGVPGLDPRMAATCELWWSVDAFDDVALDPATLAELRSLMEHAQAASAPLWIHLHGPADSAARTAVAAVAAAAGRPLLVVDLALMPSTPAELRPLLELAIREAWLHDAVPFLDGLDAIDDGPLGLAVANALEGAHGVVVLRGEHPACPVPAGAPPTAIAGLPVSTPDARLRRAIWGRALAQAAVPLEPARVDALASGYRLTGDQIARATAVAIARAAPAIPSEDDLRRAARAGAGRELAALARKVECVAAWDDLVLPADSVDQLRELCGRVRASERVLGDWGFAARPGVHAGVSALFAGPPGTGKTMAAEVVARELGLDLYAIDLSRVASKYVGDTEKNLDGIFAAAEQSNAILLFDEADALFGKRSEVRDSHDRYANLEVSFLLQRFDAHPGVSILATNMREHLDDAFSRRLTFVIDFPFPDADERLRLWERAWPPGVPRAQEMDASRLAGRFALTGGEITNVALAAAFLAAASGKALDEDHVRRALLREQLKTGRGVPAPLDQPDRPEGTGS
jgi:hypothetical protein